MSKEELKTRWGLPGNSRVILFVGSLKSMKNPDSLVDAAINMGAEQLKRQQLHFMVAGSGHLMDDLKRKCEQAGIEEQVHFTGLVARHQIPELYKIADLYTITSDYEGTPLSLLEAFCNGIPVVASDVSGISSLIVDGVNGILFPVKDADRLSNALQKLLKDPIEAARLGKAGYEYYHQHFSYEKMIDEYEKLFSPDSTKAKVLHIDDFKKGKVKPIKSL
jgi:glycosyltransferase involved in cell wall biosynthesis